MSKTLTASEMCPMDLGINILSGKWKLKILWNIQRKNIIRFNELQKLLGSITTKTLTNQLRELEEQKIIRRNVYPEIPPKVEYSLTELGESIIPVLKMLCEWGKEYQKAIKNGCIINGVDRRNFYQCHFLIKKVETTKFSC